ncbi:MAG TPA: hypothetical protein DCL61_18300 [Cyanobacteria bacterium UBA12227]|nr:hypothetical protein [Cyanobacteria bacterium UBA12227]HAX89560.1 hypothetical protein [Cyanobacteria bacterium UBA11370]HBY81536.1 hypothetical protein [Cyanobacteria bacterium UBA11148]
MVKVRIGNVIISSNNSVTKSHSTILTKNGYNLVKNFIENISRDFRDLFPVLWEKYQSQPVVFFDSTFRRMLSESKSFNKFILGVYISQLFQSKIPFDFHLQEFLVAYQSYKHRKETGARACVVGAFHILASIYPQGRLIFPELTDSLDITENINFGRIIYIDDYIALTYNQDVKNKDLGELLFAAKNSNGIWSFNKTDISVPVKSLRQAKQALADYQGKARKGELIGNDAERFSKFLGLKIKDNYAYMPQYQETKNYRGKGFR